MRILITGGAGFIGSHLAENFLSEDNQVAILDNFASGKRRNLEGLEQSLTVHEGDIRNSELVDSLVSNSDVIIHLAAALGVKTILESPIESISTNIHGSEIVLNSAQKFNKRIVIASTSEVYGKNPKQPLSETDDRVVGAPQKIRWTYSDSKAIEEATAHAMFRENGLKVTTIRFFNTVGPRQASNYGMVIPNFVASALRNEPIRIYGDGEQTRVFCHVSDATRAVMSLLENDASIGEVFNVGGIEEISMNGLAHRVIEAIDSTSTLTHVAYEDAYLDGFEDMQRRVPDISKIRNFCGWEPQINLDQIISSVAKEMSKDI
jgi:UDP-glucose 4-epimerase